MGLLALKILHYHSFLCPQTQRAMQLTTFFVCFFVFLFHEFSKNPQLKTWKFLFCESLLNRMMFLCSVITHRLYGNYIFSVCNIWDRRVSTDWEAGGSDLSLREITFIPNFEMVVWSKICDTGLKIEYSGMMHFK